MRPAPPQPVICLVSVGGSPAPVIATLSIAPLQEIWFFCSADSLESAQTIAKKFPEATHRFSITSNPQSLSACYNSLRADLRNFLAECQVEPERVRVDFTGGTKAMSAALVLTASEYFTNFSYVGGDKRDKDGLGVVVDGAERPMFTDNPWRTLGIREIDRILPLWKAREFSAAAAILEGLRRVHPQSHRCVGLARLAQALAFRMQGNYGKAAERLKSRIISSAFPEKHPLADFEAELLSRSLACSVQHNKQPNPAALLNELCDVALELAAIHRYVEAAGRLYRAMEKQVQIWLFEVSEGLIQNGCAEPDIQLPPRIEAALPNPPDPELGVLLSLESGLRCLANLDHPRARAIIEKIDRNPKGNCWRNATSARNHSILGHGDKPVTQNQFKNLLDVAHDYLGLPQSPSLTPPEFDPDWLAPE